MQVSGSFGARHSAAIFDHGRLTRIKLTADGMAPGETETSKGPRIMARAPAMNVVVSWTTVVSTSKWSIACQAKLMSDERADAFEILPTWKDDWI